MRKVMLALHRYLGLVSGILVILISLSGALYAFADEIFAWAHRDLLVLPEPVNKPDRMVPALQQAQAALGPDQPVYVAVSYADPSRSWRFRAGKWNDTSWTWFGNTEYDREAYVHPATGDVLGILDREMEFFQIVKMFHWSLLLNTAIGQPIVGGAVVVFLVMLSTGFWLYRPRSWAQLFSKLRPRWPKGIRAKLFLTHGWLGLWVLPMAFVLAVTGLVWAFRFVMMAVYVLASWSVEPPDRSMPASAGAGVADSTVLDVVYRLSWQRHPDATSIWIYVPAPDDTSDAAISVYVRKSEAVYYKSVQEAYDRKSGALLKSRAFADANRGEKLVTMNYDIHVGAILGLPGKIIAFVASLFCALLPITGYWMYRKRTEPR